MSKIEYGRKKKRIKRRNPQLVQLEYVNTVLGKGKQHGRR